MNLQSQSRTVLAIALLGGASLFVAGCGDKSSSETVGQKMDRTVDKVAAATDRATAATAAAVDDATLTAKVKTAIIAEPGMNALQIDVDTKNAIVSLTGNVDTTQVKARAAQLAETVPGVRSVVNNLVVKAG